MIRFYQLLGSVLLTFLTSCTMEVYAQVRSTHAVGADNASPVAYSIVSDDVDSTGITSAYSKHRFYVSPSTNEFVYNQWKVTLPLTDDNTSILSSSNEQSFEIPQITNPDIYKITKESNIQGEITYEGKINGTPVSLSYPITFELAPKIISASIISTEINANNPNYFDADVEIKYEGSNYLHAYVEEENSTFLTTYYSSTPNYTKLTLKDIALCGKAWLNILIKNNYGSDNLILDLNTDVINPSLINHPQTEKESVLLNARIYDLQGQYLGLYQNMKDVVPKGVYLIKVDGSESRNEAEFIKMRIK